MPAGGLEAVVSQGTLTVGTTDVTLALVGEGIISDDGDLSAVVFIRLRSRKSGTGSADALLTGQQATISQGTLTIGAIQNQPPVWNTVPNPVFTQGTAGQVFPVSGTYQSNGYVSDPNLDVITLTKNSVFVQGVTWDGGKFLYDGTGTGAIVGGHVLTANDGHGGIVQSSAFTIRISALQWTTSADINIAPGGTYSLANDRINTTLIDEDYATQAGTLPSGLTLDTETGLITADIAAPEGTFSGWQPIVYTEDDPPAPPGPNLPPVWSGSTTLTFVNGTALTLNMQDVVSDPESTAVTIGLISLDSQLTAHGISWNEVTDSVIYNGTLGLVNISNALSLQASDGVNVVTRVFSVAIVDATAQQFISADILYPHEGTMHWDWVEYQRLPWINLGGDYADVNGVSNATGGVPTTAYATFNVTDTDVEKTAILQSANFTALVQGMVNGTIENRGLMIKNVSGSGAFNAHSTRSTTGTHPKLFVTTASGETEIEPVSDNHILSSSSGGSLPAPETILRFTTGRRAILKFDLSSFAVGSVLDVRLELSITTPQFGALNVGIFRVDLSQHQAPIPYQVGIADAYTLDVGLESHQDVVFYHDLTDMIPGDDAGNITKWQDVHGWTGHRFDGRNEIVAATDPDPGNPPSGYVPLYPGCTALRASINPPVGGFEYGSWYFYKNMGAAWETYNAARGNPGHPYEPEEVYFRWYLFVGENWDVVAQGGKFTGMWSAYNGEEAENIKKPNYPISAGNSGDLSFTCSGWTERNRAFTHRPGVPLYDIGGYRAFGRLYENWMSVAEGQNTGDDHLWASGALGYLKKGTWNCLEMRIKMNTIDTSGATKCYIGYPWGSLHLGPVSSGEQPSGDNIPNRTNTCAATGTASTIVLDAGAATGSESYTNQAVWVTSRPTEIRRVIANNGATPPVLTIASYNGGSATWDNIIPQAGEQFSIQQNTIINERTNIPYGNKSGWVYGDENMVFNTRGGASKDTAILLSAGVGRRDGILQQWINGRLAYSRNDLWWRSLPEIQIQNVVGRGFLGGDPNNPGPIPYRHDCYYTHFVAAKSYIGPMKGL